jgi:hypothetical protein
MTQVDWLHCSKTLKIINLTYMTFILNSIFTILFYVMR